MGLLRAAASGPAPEGCAWMEPAAARAAMPTAMRRLLDLLLTSG
jgi:A/G-specific adenine glycosylase